jgi:hypothetical protein
VAALYGVETRDINKSVKNNPDKFPDGYIISLSNNEKAEVVENFHHLEKLKFSPVLPKAFTDIDGIKFFLRPHDCFKSCHIRAIYL